MNLREEDLREKIRTCIILTFRRSRNSQGQQDFLSAMSIPEIDAFIEANIDDFNSTIDILKSDSTSINTDVKFLNSPIGCKILLLKTKRAMIDELIDLGQEFVSKHMTEIENAAYKMYNCYKEDNELIDLYIAENDWYSEFLYENIDTPVFH
jgi:hypothetical protein